MLSCTVSGYLLMSLGMGTRREWTRAEPEWTLRYESFKALQEHPTPYELRLHVYMARDLPAADADGLVDPYLKIRFADQKVGVGWTHEHGRQAGRHLKYWGHRVTS